MWEVLLEWLASVLGLTARPRSGQLVVACLVVGVLGLVGIELWGPSGLIVPAGIVLLTAGAVRQVAGARDALWRAACLTLDAPLQQPAPVMLTGAMAPSARALAHLGAAVDDARRGHYTAANDALPRVDRSLLRPEEIRLFDAVRAMISLGLGDTGTAAKLAVAALPTGSEEIDAHLGRAVITEAWSAPERLRVIHADWENKGIAADQDGTLARLHRLTRLRIDARFLDDVGAAEARMLSSEARAVGDEDFAADLEARAHDSAYR
jgi:hypothetical protein